MLRARSTPPQLLADLQAGQRRGLARAITLIESEHPADRADADWLLAHLPSNSVTTLRIGIAGPPGAGKSTLIETLGLAALAAGHSVAVLAVDPSSPMSGGAILGDKTRMVELARDSRAFIRPSPSAGALGGAHWRTRDAIRLCEAAHFDLVIVESVGVGQSETAVADMVDIMVLVLSPAGGDDLQGMKKGIVEVADVILVNKADGDWRAAAERTAADYRSALQLLRPSTPDDEVMVQTCSALTGESVPGILAMLRQRHRRQVESGTLLTRRNNQGLKWMWEELRLGLLARFRQAPAVARFLPGIEQEVRDGRLPARLAAKKLLQAFLDSGETNA